MAETGARTHTKVEVDQNVYFDLPQETLHPAFNALNKSLSTGLNNPKPETGQKEKFQMNIAVAVWGQKDFQISPAY